MSREMSFDARELKEIKHALYYKQNLAHGTVGHNMLMLIAKMAEAAGMFLDENGVLSYDDGFGATSLELWDNENPSV